MTTRDLVQVAIKLDYDAVAVYTGGVEGFEATSPMVTGVPLSERPEAATRYENYIAGQEAAFIEALHARVPNVEIGTTLRTVYGGISATIPANAVETVLDISGAVAVQKNDLRQPLTDSSPEFVNATALYDELGTTANAGQGLILGNLDTGVWPEHPSFADQGNLPPPGGPERACDFGDNPLTPAIDVFQCQNKLIGGQAFSDGYFDRPGRPAEPFPDSARDSNGHGTHTTSTSAGNMLDEAPVFGVDRGPVHGIAPGAYIMEYKVCYAEGCNVFDSANAVEQASPRRRRRDQLLDLGRQQPVHRPRGARVPRRLRGRSVRRGVGRERRARRQHREPPVAVGHHRGGVHPDPRVRHHTVADRGQRRHVHRERGVDHGWRRPAAGGPRSERRGVRTHGYTRRHGPSAAPNLPRASSLGSSSPASEACRRGSGRASW